jgi:hypothetical protein
MTYKFEQFKTEITDPTVEVKSVTDDINAKTCTAEVILKTDKATFGVVLSGFTYLKTWADADIIKWVNTELTKYKI